MTAGACPSSGSAAVTLWLGILAVVSIGLSLTSHNTRSVGQFQPAADTILQNTRKEGHIVQLLPFPDFSEPIKDDVSATLGEDAVRVISSLRELLSNLTAVGNDAARPFGYRGDRRRVQAGFARAMTDNGLRIVVIGGSMPQGSQLKHRLSEAWPYRLEKLMRVVWPSHNVTVTNLAVGGVPSNPQVPMVSKYHREELSNAHLVLVDIAINDRVNNPALYLSANATKFDKDGDGRCLKVEGCELMDALLLLSPKSGIVYVETFPTAFRYATIRTAAEYHAADAAGFPQHAEDSKVYSKIKPSGWRTNITLRALPGDNGGHQWAAPNFRPAGWNLSVASNWHWPRLLQRKLPVISYGDGAAKAALLSKGHHPLILWSQYPHPDDRTHMLCALIVLHGLADMLINDVATKRETEWNRQLIEAKDAIVPEPSFMAHCHVNMVTEIGVHMVKGKTSSGVPAFDDAMAGAGWQYFEDVPGKPGWIFGVEEQNLTSSRHSVEYALIGFNVTLGPRRRVVLTNLRTYGHNLGTAECMVGCANQDDPKCPSVVIETKWEKHFSQEAVSTLVIPSDAQHSGSGWGNQDVSTVWCRAANDGKFKLLAVGTC